METTKITKLDIKALKESDAIFYDYNNFSNNNKKESYIRCIKEKNDNNPFQQEYLIKTNVKFILSNPDNRNNDKKYNENDIKRCFVSTHYNKNYSDFRNTYIRHLKENDEITLIWSFNYYLMNGYLAKSKTEKIENEGYLVSENEYLNSYVLILRINRELKNNKNIQFEYIIDSQICANNNAANIRFNDTF